MIELELVVESYINGDITIEEAVQALKAEAKELDDLVRITIVGELTEAYYEKHGKHVKETMLERLADILLVADLRAKRKPKREYPIMSEVKLADISARHENTFASFDYFDEKGRECTPASVAGTSGRFTGGNTFYI